MGDDEAEGVSVNGWMRRRGRWIEVGEGFKRKTNTLAGKT